MIVDTSRSIPASAVVDSYEADRSEKIWTEDNMARFLAVATPGLATAVVLALWSGQRQGDLLRLPHGFLKTANICGCANQRRGALLSFR